MRGVRIAGAMLVAGLIAGSPVGVASADSTSVPGSVTTLSQESGPLTVTVPPGTTPTALTGVLTMPSVVEGSGVTLLVNGRVAGQVASTLYTKVTVPLLPADVVADGTLALTIKYDAPVDTTVCQAPPAITLRKVALEYTGTETPPTSVSTFFPPNASRIDVKIPRDTTDDVIQAAFNAVASLSDRYSADTPVVLSTTDEPLATTGAAQRVVSFVGSEEGVSTTIDNTGGVPTLVMAGAGLQLSDAARSLGTDELALANGSTTDGLSRQIEARDDGLTRTLTQLRADSPSTTSDAVGTEQVQIRQDSFGTATSSLKVHLEGTHSAVPADADARLDVYADDQLVSSSTIGTDPAIDLDFTIPSSKLRSTTVLRATVHSVADGALPCSPGLPLELSLDDDASTVTATAGTGSLRGFQLFPQSLDGRLPVAIRASGETKLDGAIDAATVISALQRQAAAPLDVTIVDPDVFVKGQRSGLLVGAQYADSVAINSPLRLSGTRLLNSADAKFEVGSNTPFAALEAVAQRGRFVLMLGSWAPGDVAASPNLSHRITERITTLGWNALDDDVMIADASGTPYTVDSGTTVETDKVPAKKNSFVKYFAAGIFLLLVLLALQIALALRRDRRAARRASPSRPDLGQPAALPAARPRPEATSTPADPHGTLPEPTADGADDVHPVVDDHAVHVVAADPDDAADADAEEDLADVDDDVVEADVVEADVVDADVVDADVVDADVVDADVDDTDVDDTDVDDTDVDNADVDVDVDDEPVQPRRRSRFSIFRSAEPDDRDDDLDDGLDASGGLDEEGFDDDGRPSPTAPAVDKRRR